MNVLFLIGSYSSFGGTERITTVLANALAKEGRVHIAAFRERCDPQKLGLDAAVKCHELGKHPAKALRKILVEHQIDVIVNHFVSFGGRLFIIPELRHRFCKYALGFPLYPRFPDIY